MVRVDGKLKYRMLVLGSSGEETGVSEPIALALHPASGRLFWLDRGGKNGVSPKVGKVNMDGSDPQVIVSKNLQSPEFMTIDLQKEVLYFSTSHGAAKIESCNLDGSNRQASFAMCCSFPHFYQQILPFVALSHFFLQKTFLHTILLLWFPRKNE